MNILLLHVASFSLEGGIAGPAVDKHGAGDDAGRDAIGENIEKSCLAGTGNTLGFILC
jgi:hypothetical protein